MAIKVVIKTLTSAFLLHVTDERQLLPLRHRSMRVAARVGLRGQQMAGQACLGGGVRVGVCLRGVLLLLLVGLGGLGGVLVHIGGERC